MVVFQMSEDAAARKEKVPRWSSPVSFESYSVFSWFYIKSIFILTLIFSCSANFASAENLKNLQNLQNLRNLQIARSCPTSFNRNTDYFPEKVTTTFGSEFSVSYHKSYKVVTNLRTADTYVIYLCNTPNPDTDAQLHATLPDVENPTFVEFPPLTFGMASQTFLPFFSVLQVNAGLKMYTSVALLPPCIDDSEIARPAEDCLFPNFETCTQELWENMGDDAVTMFFTDSFSLVDPPVIPGKVLATIIVAQELSVSVFAEASWLQYLSLFFDAEEKGLDTFASFQAQVLCFIDALNTPEQAAELEEVFVGAASRRMLADDAGDVKTKGYLRDEFYKVANPVARRHLLENYFFKPNHYRQRPSFTERRLEISSDRGLQTTENVLILTGFEANGDSASYYVGICDNYYCDFSRATGAQVDVIDANDLDISFDTFFLASEEDIKSKISELGVQIDYVIFLYYLHLPTGGDTDYPGPHDNNKTFFNDFVKALNPKKSFYIPDTDKWFSFRAGVPQFVLNDFINMLNPEGSSVLEDHDSSVFYFFDEYVIDQIEDDVAPKALDALLSSDQCSTFEAPICAATRSPTPPPGTKSPVPGSSSKTILNVLIGVGAILASILGVYFA